MASTTPNINLTLPTGAEKVSRQIINDNNTKIDTAIGTLNSNLAPLTNGIQRITTSSTVSHTLTFSNGTVALIGVASANGQAYGLYYAVKGTSLNIDKVAEGNNISYSTTSDSVTFSFGDNTARQMSITKIMVRGNASDIT